ncbi:MAG: TrbG/VirB9 family P-type conjugative transfer protein [Candidatus Woesearchaeota archaeon]|nr:TrbG/VirB9 family P-type conjugative transfer protein [Candidatus Woesearchaeota archaeon]
MKIFNNLTKTIPLVLFLAPSVAYSADLTDLLMQSPMPKVQQSVPKYKQSKTTTTMEKALNAKNLKAVTSHRYDRFKTYKIKLGLYLTTTISLPKNEKILTYSVGDGKVFDVEHDKALPNILTINTYEEGYVTNLTVITDKNQKIYNFLLKSYNSDRWVIPGFTYYITQSEEVEIAERLTKLKSNNKNIKDVEKLDQLNTSYKIKGDDLIAPKYAYDDGKFTYLDFGDRYLSDRMPTVYKVVDGYDSVINKHMEGNILVVETLSPEGFTLKNGDSHVCIIPKKKLSKVYKDDK